MDLRQLDAALDPIRPSLDTDGFSLHVSTRDADTVRVVLEATPAACLDCLVPADLLERIVLDALSHCDTSVRRIDIERRGFGPTGADPSSHGDPHQPS